MIKCRYLSGTISNSQNIQRLDKALAGTFSHYSRSQIKSWILNGLVRINGRVVIVPKKTVLGGEKVEIKAVTEEAMCWEAQAISLNIIYEDDDIIVINKPRDLVMHPGPGNPNCTVLNALLYYFPPIIGVKRAGIVHRLDKNTTGLIVVAKTFLAQTRLVELFKNRQITREYEAVAMGAMTTGGKIEQPIARHATKRRMMAVRLSGKPSVTHYHIMKSFRFHTHLRLHLETGRTHQIRVHMAHINYPLVGDPLYSFRIKTPKGAPQALNEALGCFDRQALHASFLRLQHPITLMKMEWHAPLPRDMVTLISALQTDMELFQEKEKP